MRHPKDMGKPEAEAFLTTLANEMQVFSATHRQALNAFTFELTGAPLVLRLSEGLDGTGDERNMRP